MAAFRVFVVCVDPERGRFVAFQDCDPDKKTSGYSREAALAEFLEKFVPSHQVTDIEP